MKHRLWLGASGIGFWLAAVAVKDVLRPMASVASPGSKLLLAPAPSFLSAIAIPLFFLAVHPAPSTRDVGVASL